MRFPRLSTRNRLAIAIRMEHSGSGSGDGGLWRLILPFAAGEEIPLDERVERAVRHLFGTDSYRTIWQSEFRLHRRVASRFNVGRVVLAGDAAHLNSPVGGQGMNAGIQDVEALLPFLLEAIEGDMTEPLERYEDRRRAEIERGVNRFTDRLTRLLLFGGGRFLKPALGLVSWVLRIGSLRRRLLRRIAMLDPSRNR